MKARNATVAVIGAGDFIGSAIAQRFAAEGYIVFAGRRTAEKLATLKSEIEAAGGRCVARGLDARKEEDVTAFLNEADAIAPLEVCIFNPGANVNFPILETTERVFRKVWEMACYGGFLDRPRSRAPDAAAREGHDHVHRRDRQLARRHRLRRLCQREIRPARRRAKHGARARARRTSMSPISSSMPASTPRSCANASRQRGGEEAVANLQPDQLMNPQSVAEAYWYAAQPDARRLDLRTRSAPLSGDMVMKQVEFLFDFGSPNAYFAHQVIPEIEKRTGVTFQYVPVLLGGIFKLTNNKPPMVAFGGIAEQDATMSSWRLSASSSATALQIFKFNPILPGQHADADAHGGGGARWRAILRALCRRGVPSHVGRRPRRWTTRRSIRAALIESGLMPTR